MHVFAFIYIHNKYTQYTHIYYVNKTFILDAFDSTSFCTYTRLIWVVLDPVDWLSLYGQKHFLFCVPLHTGLEQHKSE